jgi:UDP-N-acetylmuramate-alanine ligase
MPRADNPNVIQRARSRARAVLGHEADRLLVIDVPRQRLLFVASGEVRAEYPCSTAAAGVGGADGSFRTPLGVHTIARRIGAGAPSGTVFESREPTGERWLGAPDARDLILTRILTLAGCEDGVNLGPGCDSLARYIYIHGTNHEPALGTPTSHGCIRLSNQDVIELHDRVEAGDPVVVVAAPEEEPPLPLPVPERSHFFYAGVAGGGMSALAQFQAMRGGRATGSDRTFDRGGAPAIREALERAGVGIVPQDGSGVGPDLDAVIVSTAVEDTVPDMRAARAHAIPVYHRSELLAAFAAAGRSIAVAGTSGKSTVVAMIFELLRAAGHDLSVISGAELTVLRERGYLGNAWAGSSDLVVIEADESDGSLVRYAPMVGVVLNLDKDHREVAEVRAMFDRFRSRTRGRFVVGEGENLAHLRGDAIVFGTGPAATLRAEAVELGPHGSRFTVDGVPCELPVPGLHNVENALAALATGQALGVPVAAMAPGLAAFRGVARRLEVMGEARGVIVIDDFAHNPAKVRAAIDAVRLRQPARILAVY